jgi:hypothetical protein
MLEDDAIPIVALHRGIGIEDGQPVERIEVVKRAIDRVHGMDDLEQLVVFAANAHNPPESRLFAAAKVEVLFELCVEERRIRPPVDLLQVRASTAGLGSVRWRDPDFYASLLDQSRSGAPGAVERDEPLPDLADGYARRPG